MPGWVGPVAAISLVVIALSFIAIAVGFWVLSRATLHGVTGISRRLDALSHDAHEALDAVRQIAKTGEEVSGKLKEELQHYLATSRAIRHDLERGVRQVKNRLADLDALYEVVHEEVEDTALEVAAKVRSVRRGAGMVGRLRRWLVRGRR
jgi:methyl-accepting chemotaxis protein